MIFAMASCGGATATESGLVALSISPASATLRIGATVQLSASTGSGGAEQITFSSDNPSVVSVSAQGLGRAVSIGSALVRARTAAGATGVATITVTPAQPANVEKTAGDGQSAIAGTAVGVAPSVTVRDSAGNLLANVSVTFAVASGGGAIVGESATTTASGVATLQSWTLGNAAGVNSVLASVAGLPPVTFTATATRAILELSRTSISFSMPTVGVNPASELVAIGNAGTGTLTGLSLGSILYAGDVSGWLSATLNRTLTPAGVTLRVSATALPAGTYSAAVPVLAPNVANAPQSIAVTLVVGPASSSPAVQLGVAMQPGGSASGALLTPQPVVEVRSSGVVVADATSLVTASVASGSGTLSGTTTVAAVLGVATFTSLRITGAGVHTLRFTSSVAAPAVSAPFTVVSAVSSATQLVISTQPTGAESGSALTAQPVVSLRDASGALAASATDAVTATLNGGGGTLSGTTTVTAVNGIASFSGLKVTGAGSYSLTFSASGLAPAISIPFAIAPVAAGSIAIQVGTAAVVPGAVGANLVIPIIVDMSNAAGRTLASLSITLSWDASRLDFVSSSNGTFGTSGSFFVNSANQANGSIAVSIFDSSGFSSGTPTIYTITLRPKASGVAAVTASVQVAGDAGGNAFSASALSSRPLSVNIP